MQLIFPPVQGIRIYIIPDLIEFNLIADNMLVIIALPDIGHIQFGFRPGSDGCLEPRQK